MLFLPFVIVVAVGLFLPLMAAAGHVDPSSPLPLTQGEYESLYESTCGSNTTQDIEDNPPPDSKLASDKNNLYTGEDFDTEDDTSNIAIWQNGDDAEKETSFEISGQRIVVNGDIVARSHLKMNASDTILAHATEYGEASVSGKDAFDLSGEDNCFNLEPDQVERNDPPAPEGFPFADQFDPDGNGNILEHFLPGGSFGFTAASPNYYRCTTSPTVNTIPGPLKCSGGKIDGTVQNEEMPPGIYLASGDVSINASDLSAQVTVVSGGKLDVSGSTESEFFPFYKNLLFASQWNESGEGTANTDKGEGALKTGGSHSLFTGITVATNGENEASGSQNSWTCPLMGDTVTLDGSLLYISGDECGAPGLDIDKTPDGGLTLNVGDNATFTITVTNDGTESASLVTIDDEFPGGPWTIVSANKQGVALAAPDGCAFTNAPTNNILHCGVAVLGENEVIEVVVQRPTTTADCAGQPAAVRLDNGSLTPDTSDDAEAAATGVSAVFDPGHTFVECPDITVVKTPDEPDNDINAGATATFTVKFVNLGPGQATGVGTLPPHDALPGTGWTESAGDPLDKCTVAANVLQCSGITLAAPNAGDTDEYTVSVSRPTSAATECGTTLPNTVTVTADGDIGALAANNTDTAEIDIICGAIRILKNSTKGGAVNTFGTVFDIDGPDDGPAAEITVTDSDPATAPDEDADKGEICIDNLQIGGLYTVTEITPPTGYALGVANDNTAVAVAGTCPTAPFGTDNVATFTNPPKFDIQVNFRDGGSGETNVTTPPGKIDCDNNGTSAAGDTKDATPAPNWQSSVTHNGLVVSPDPTETIVCTIIVDP